MARRRGEDWNAPEVIEVDYGDENDVHYDPPLRKKIEILWRERQWARQKRADRMMQLRIYSAWIAGGTTLAAFVSSIMGYLPWKKP